MARPPKEGLEYFPLDVDIDMDDKVALIEAKHGLIGFAIVIKLLMKIYKNSYFYEWSEKEQLLFSKRVNVDINSINEVVNDCVKWNLFDKRTFEDCGILSSRGIQRRYLKAVERRKNVQIRKNYLLLDSEEVNAYTNLVIVDNNGHSNNIDGIICTQSKGKDSRGKDNKEKDTTKRPLPAPKSKKLTKIKYAEFVSLTNDEYSTLIEKIGEPGTIRCIEILDNYKGANGKNYKSDYRAILNWVIKRYEEETSKMLHKENNNYVNKVKNLPSPRHVDKIDKSDNVHQLSSGFKMATEYDWDLPEEKEEG